MGGPNAEPGTGPGGFASGFDNDVPHFNQRGHYQTHSTIEKMRRRTIRKRGVSAEDLDLEGGGSMLFNFVLISGILGLVFFTGAFAFEREQRGSRSNQKDEA